MHRTSSCGSATNAVAYDSHGYVDYMLDFNGNKTDYTYGAAGLLLDWTVAAGTPLARKKVNTWTAVGGINKIGAVQYYGANSALFMSVAYAYITASGPSLGMLQSEVWKDGSTGHAREIDYAYVFDGNAHLTSSSATRQLPSGAATVTQTYDSRGHLTSISDAANNTVSYSNFDGLGNPQTIATAAGALHDLTYDAFGNVTSDLAHLTQGDHLISYTYDGDSHLTRIALPDGSGSTMAYTPMGRLKQVSDPLGFATNTAYVPASNAYTSTSEHDTLTWSGATPTVTANGNFSANWQLDSRGRTWKQAGNNGQLVANTIDAQGNVTDVADVLSTTLKPADALNRQSSQSNPDGGQVIYNYGTDGRFIGVRTPRGLVFSSSFDGLGNVLSVTNPDSGNITYAPDVFGRSTIETRSNGTVIAYTWDNLDRLRTRKSGTATETFNYDEGNGKGQLTSFAGRSTSRSYGFDNAGRVISQTDVILGATYSTAKSYDALGRLSAQTYPSGLRLSYGYDTIGRLSAITSNAGSVVSSLIYQPAGGALYGWHYGNGQNRSLSLDTDGRVTQVLTTGQQNQSFAYYADNTLKSLTDSLSSATGAGYTYDSNKRLQSVTLNNDNQSFAWDVDSNRTASARAGVTGIRTLPGGHGDAPVSFAWYWRPGGSNDYKLRNSMYDAYGNFAYGATGATTGYSCSVLTGVGDLLHKGSNNPINTLDISQGFNAINKGEIISIIDFTPHRP